MAPSGHWRLRVTSTVSAQALIEMALVMPILILLLAGALSWGFALFNLQLLQHVAIQAANGAAAAPSDGSRCAEARKAALAAAGWKFSDCDGDLLLEVDPSDPKSAQVTVTMHAPLPLALGLPHDSNGWVVLRASAGSVLTPCPSGGC